MENYETIRTIGYVTVLSFIPTNSFYFGSLRSKALLGSLGVGTMEKRCVYRPLRPQNAPAPVQELGGLTA
eukprot:1176310-Prorocentrum_minimum.AAC.3